MAVELTQEIDISLIRIDGDTQPRAALNHDTINDYAQSMNEGDIFPPIIVHYDGKHYWLTDGFHRYYAAKLAGRDTVDAEIRQGDRRKAKWESYAVNKKNGMRMTTADKQKIVTEILQDPEWSQYPNTVIASHCGVDKETVRKYRNSQTSEIRPLGYMGSERENDGYQASPTNNWSKPQPEIPMLPFQELAREEIAQDEEEDEEVEDTEEDRYMRAVDTGTTDYYHDDLRREAFARDEEEREIKKEQRNTHVMQVMGSSDSPEWYTPTWIVEKVLELMGTIDLDPCSNSHEDPKVPATTRYTKEDNGLSLPWKGRTYLNPPYGSEISIWTSRLIEAYKAGDVPEAVTLLPGRIDTNWFSPLYEYLICIIKGRVQFENSPHHAPFPCVLVYLGDRRDEFAKVFSSFGPIVERIA